MTTHIIQHIFSIHTIIQLIKTKIKNPLTSNIKTHKTKTNLYIKTIKHTNTP